jgi:hypothetical protein
VRATENSARTIARLCTTGETSGDTHWLSIAVALLTLASFTRFLIGGVHLTDIFLIAASALCLTDAMKRRAAPVLPGLAAAFVALVAVSLCRASTTAPALAEMLKQAELLLLGVTVFTYAATRCASGITTGIAAGSVVSVLVALLQYLRGTDWANVGGLIENRSLYGACIAAGAPFVIAAGAALSSTGHVAVTGLFVLLAGISILSAPMLLIFAAASALAARQHGTRIFFAAMLALTLVLILVATRALPRDNAAALLDSVSAFHNDGTVRRAAVEATAGARAVVDRPLLGHGPGSYQNVVGMGEYRGTLPPPVENKVERGSNPGWLVAAVEFGVPAALILFALLLASGVYAARGAKSSSALSAAAISAFALLAASLFTVVLVRGPGMFLAAVVGIAFSARIATAPLISAILWRQFLLQAGGVAACAVLGIVLRQSASGDPQRAISGDVAGAAEESAADLSGAGRAVIVLEAEDCGIAIAPLKKIRRHDASDEGCVTVELGAGKPPEAEGSAVYAVNVKNAARFRIWLRAWWSDGCANSIAVSLNGAPPRLLGNDGTYATWHWVRGPVVELRAGTHLLSLHHREDGVSIDQILLSNDDAYLPQPVEVATQRPEATPTPAPIVAKAPDIREAIPPRPTVVEKVPVIHETPPPVETPQPVPMISKPVDPAIVEVPAVETPQIESHARAPKKFTVGIAGRFRDGFEGHLLALGIPYTRLNEKDTGNIDALKSIDVLIVSDPAVDPGAFSRTLYAFLRAGKTAIVEFRPSNNSGDEMPGPVAEVDDPDDLFLLRDAPVSYFHNATLIADDSLYFNGLPRERRLSPRVNCFGIPLASTVPGVKIYGALGANGGTRKVSGALMVREFGGGKLYYMGAAAAWGTMWQERKPDPFALNILRDVVKERADYLYEKFQYAPKQTARVNVSDDFMRNAGQFGEWKIEGDFTLSGPRREEEFSFAMRGAGIAIATIGNETWQQYRPSAAVRVKQGDAGIWQALPGGKKICLRLREGMTRAALILRDGDKDQVLDEVAIPPYENGWRRLSLLHRDGEIRGFVDGMRMLNSKDVPKPGGPCGLCVFSGIAGFDDFRAIDLDQLTAARDVAPGEESSERCITRYHHRCYEKHTIYSPHWFLPPSTSDAGSVVTALPLFRGATLQFDDRRPLVLQPSAEHRTIPLVEAPPQFNLTLHAPLWRDYHFAGRVTDWYPTSGQWGTVHRWSCDPEYQWFGGKADGDALLWRKHNLRGNVAFEVAMAPRADRVYREERGSDLNLVVHGNGRDLSEGYLFTVKGDFDGCTISRNGKVVAHTPGVGLPLGLALHHTWFTVGAEIIDGNVRMYFDRRLVAEFKDDAPITEGKAGIWTRRNKISVARATLSLSNAETADGR